MIAVSITFMSIILRNMNIETRNEIESFLRKNVLENLYILHDLEKSDKRAKFQVAYSGTSVIGVFLFFEFPTHPILWIVGENEAVEEYLKSVKLEKFVMIAEKRHLEAIKDSFNGIKHYDEYVMQLQPTNARFFLGDNVRRVEPGQAYIWAKSVNNGNEPDASLISDSRRELLENDCFAAFVENEIVSRGVVHAKSRFGWAIGGIYTLPNHRNNGFSTSVMSHIIKYGSDYTSRFVLFVRKDNAPAVSSYRKVGFEVIGEKVFIDYNIGKVP